MEVIQVLSDAADDMHNAAACAVHADEIDRYTVRAERYDALSDELIARWGLLLENADTNADTEEG
jgi:hypothetical protein